MAGAPRPQDRVGSNGQPISARQDMSGNIIWTDASNQIYDDSGNPTGQQFDRYQDGINHGLGSVSDVRPPQLSNPALPGAGPGAADSGMSGPNLDSAGQSGADRYKLIQMHLAALANQAYRPEMAAAGTRALQSSLSAYAPMENVMGSMYGPEGQVDLTKASQNPLTQAMMQIGAPNQKDIGLSTPPQGPPGGPPPMPMPQTPGASMPGLHRGPDGKLYDAQGRLVQ